MVHRAWVAFVAVAAAISLLAAAAGTASVDDQTVAVQDNSYAPASVTINVGDTVTWNWTGSNPHTVTADDGSFDSPQQTSGTFEFTFDTAGTFDYVCEVHGQAMSGTVVVQAAQQETPAASPTAAAATPTPGAGGATPTVAAGSPVSAPDTGSGDASNGGSPTLWIGLALAVAAAGMLAGAAWAYQRAR